MTMPRKLLVDVHVTRYYHCISRCVRKAFLCGKGFEYRKQWLEERLELLAGQFAISVCGFSVMDNHFHLLVRLDPARAGDWSDEDVVRRWLAVYPPKKLDSKDAAAVEKWVKQQIKDKHRVGILRERLQNLGWFMKALKEPLARLANKDDQCTGAFWEGRYKSIAILDEEALLATCAYIDLNPVAAGIATTPELSPHTSLRQRIAHAKARGKLKSLKEAAKKGVLGNKSARDYEEAHWLCPMEDRRRWGSTREGILESFSLGNYLLLVDWTSRLHREGKASVPAELASIFDRLETTADVWSMRMKKLLGAPRLLGNYLASDRARLRELAKQKGVHHLDNVVTVKLTG